MSRMPPQSTDGNQEVPNDPRGNGSVAPKMGAEATHQRARTINGPPIVIVKQVQPCVLVRKTVLMHILRELAQHHRNPAREVRELFEGLILIALASHIQGTLIPGVGTPEFWRTLIVLTGVAVFTLGIFGMVKGLFLPFKPETALRKICSEAEQQQHFSKESV